MSTTSAAPESLSVFSSEAASMDRSLLSLPPEIEQISCLPPHTIAVHSGSSTDRPCMRGFRGNYPAMSPTRHRAEPASDGEADTFDDDLVTPCQGLLNRYAALSAAADPHQSWSFMDNPHQKESISTQAPSLLNRNTTAIQDSISTGGSEHTWQDSALSRLTSSLTSPRASFEAELSASQSSINNPVPPLSLTGNKKTQYKKTKMCPWHRDGKCFMGDACNYAHSREELRPKPDLSKTKLCPELMKGRQCTHQPCRFAHDYVELRATSAFFKTRICRFWQKGECPAGPECRHAHGREDLRPSVCSISDVPPAPLSARNAPRRPVHQSLCSKQREDGAWSVDESLLPPEIAPPPASSIPSPSFLSTTASSPSPAIQPPSFGGLETAQLAQTLRQCAALLTSNASAASQPPTLLADETSMSVLRSWIAQEVEKQVHLRQAAASQVPAPPAAPSIPSPPPPLPGPLAGGSTPECFKDTPLRINPEAPNFLPSNLLQGLNLSSTPLQASLPPTFNPIEASLPPTFNPIEYGWMSPKASDTTTAGGGVPGSSTPVFANAVRGLFGNGPTSSLGLPPGLLPTDWMSSPTWQNVHSTGSSSSTASAAAAHFGF